MEMRVIALSAVAVLMLSAQTARPADSTTVTIRLISHTSSGTNVLRDRAPKGTSKGDVWRLSSELRNAVPQFSRGKGAIVGHKTVVIKWLDRNRADITVRSDLPGGRLLGGGVVRFTPQMAHRITDGTGRFKNASGTAEWVEVGEDGHRRRLLYRLVLG